MKAILKYLPVSLSKRLIYRLIKIDHKIDNDIVFKVAETKDEIIQALTLLQIEFKRECLSSSNETLRATVYHAIPTSTILIIKKGTKVIGTATHVSDGPLKLPLEKAFDINKLRKRGGKISEISSLAISSAYRGKKYSKSLYLYFLNYIIRYCKQVARDETVCMAIHPKAKIYYEAIMPFKMISNDIVNYDFVGKAPAVGMYIDSTNLYKNMKYRFHIKGLKTNMFFNFFFRKSISSFVFPKRTLFNSPIKILSVKELNEIFKEKTTALKNLPNEQITKLSNIYDVNGYSNSFLKSTMPKRDSTRFFVNLEGNKSSMRLKFRITELSSGGLQINLDQDCEIAEEYMDIKVMLGYKNEVNLKTRVVWHKDNSLGLKIFYVKEADNKRWISALKYLENRFVEAA